MQTGAQTEAPLLFFFYIVELNFCGRWRSFAFPFHLSRAVDMLDHGGRDLPGADRAPRPRFGLRPAQPPRVSSSTGHS